MITTTIDPIVALMISLFLILIQSPILYPPTHLIFFYQHVLTNPASRPTSEGSGVAGVIIVLVCCRSQGKDRSRLFSE
jgi:hypothetical protein